MGSSPHSPRSRGESSWRGHVERRAVDRPYARAAAGFTLKRAEPLYASPILLSAAWLVYATEALTGNSQWFVPPIGLTVLAVVGVARWDLQARGQSPATSELVTLELLGVALLVGPAIAQTITDSVAYGLLAVALGAGIVGWGALTHVRRRCAAGACVTAIAVLLMLGVPLVRFTPEFRGSSLWVALAAIGLVLIIVATTLERGRARFRAAIRRLDQLMEGWE